MGSAAARRIRVTGIVQGVGFRPFVYGLAQRCGLSGWVLNDTSGVEIEVFGLELSIEAFLAGLKAETPPLAVIDSIQVEAVPWPAARDTGSDQDASGFVIRASLARPQAFVPVSPDIGICNDCLHELFDAQDRRFRYPFVNCTNCGPRFTIVKDIPYDRPLTTMADFGMCDACRAEYEDPTNRRFHAQPIACPRCGPQVSFLWSDVRGDLAQRVGLVASGSCWGEEAIYRAQQTLANGGIVAVKGLGGFHLACDARNDEAVARLRQRKGRAEKPLAVMALDVDAVATFAQMTSQERGWLNDRRRPIVLLRKQTSYGLSPLVASGSQTIGVMLPYTPLHYLLLSPNPLASAAATVGQVEPGSRHIAGPPAVLVMTSGNLSEEPIVKDNDEAVARLSSIADAFLTHNRDIYIHCDDSVVRIQEEHEVLIRRARGFAPSPIRLPFSVRPVLAVGGELKNAFCLTKDRFAFMSQHIGDMENLETLRAFEHVVEHYQRLWRVKPEIFACDLHPGYLATQWALDRGAQTGLPVIAVQHHHAHIAAVMAEHGLDVTAQVIGISFDGTGYGIDGTIWGGEALVCGYQAFWRVARLRPVPLPGGDAAVKRPYRTALAYLWAAQLPWDPDLPPVAACSDVERHVILRQLESGLNTVPTSSMGRLFDAVAALAGVRQIVSYEAQAAMELEALAAPDVTSAYDLFLSPATPPTSVLDGGPMSGAGYGEKRMRPQEPHEPMGLQSADCDLQFEVDTAGLFRQIVDDLHRQVPPPFIAAKFHNGAADLVLALCLELRRVFGLNRVALSGGVFQNVTLLALVVKRLDVHGFEILTHRHVPPNDGGLALGQAVVAHSIHSS